MTARSLTSRDGVAIGVLVAYTPALIISILLCIRHGFSRSSGWYFLIILCLARLLEAAFQLATINDPTNESLYIGAFILLGVGFSPLELTALGLLTRVYDRINQHTATYFTSRSIRITGLLTLVGLILSIVGGNQSGQDYARTGHYSPATLSKVSLGLYIAAFGFIAAGSLLANLHTSLLHTGEKRLTWVLTFSLPFILVRLVYACMTTFAADRTFNPISGSVAALGLMGLLVEFVCVVAYEAVGLSLRGKKDSVEYAETGQSSEVGSLHHLERNQVEVTRK